MADIRLKRTDIERLSFTRYLYRVGQNQAEEPQPMAATAILSFHDSVEMFLQHAGEFLNANRAGKSHVKFMEYWEIIGSQLPEDEQLGQKTAMRRLNDTRVNLKHQGTRPNSSDIESLSVSVEDFFVENTPKVFGIEFDEISLIYLVGYDDTRETLQDVESHIDEGEYKTAVKKLSLAYHNMFGEYNERMRDEFGYRPLAIDEFAGAPSSNDFKHVHRDLGYFVESVSNTVRAIESAIQVLSLGIDYRRYSRFDSLTPRTIHIQTGDSKAIDQTIPDGITENDVEFCLDFVIDVAIKLQEIDVSQEQ